MIAKTCKGDEPIIKEICADCSSDNVRRAYAYIRFATFHQKDVLCEVLDDVAFYVCYFGKKHCRLVELACKESHHRQGYGSAALKRIVEACKQRDIQTITFRCSSEEGFAWFYIAHGAQIVGKKGEDYEMELRLEEYID